MTEIGQSRAQERHPSQEEKQSSARRIVSIWLPNLAMDRWQLAHKGQAVPHALISDTAHGPRIEAVSDEGARNGAQPGMMLADARAIFPEITVHPSDAAGDLAFLEKLAVWALRWGPWSALDRPDGLLIDSSAVAHLFGGEAGLLEDIAEAFAKRGLRVSAAIAPTAGAAFALSHYAGNGTALSAGDDPIERLSDLPIAALRLDDDVLTVLRRLGVKRLGQLAAIEGGNSASSASSSRNLEGNRQHGPAGRALSSDPVGRPLSRDPVGRPLSRDPVGRALSSDPVGRDALHRRFRNRKSPSANPLIRLDQMLGKVPEPLLPVIPQSMPLVQRRLMEPIRHRSLLDQVLRDLSADMARDLEGKSQGARRLELALWRVDDEVIMRHLELASATRNADHMCRLFAAKLDDIEAGFGIEMVRLRASWAQPLALGQADLEAAAQAHGTSLAACIDRLTVRLGEGAVRRPVPHSSHVPERAQGWQKPLEGQTSTLSTSALQTNMSGHEQSSAAPLKRPLKLLERAEQIAVLYATPDGLPKRFRWRGTLHDITKVAGPERIAPEWWREKGGARLRDYYRIEDDRGRRYWIYRQGIVGDGRGGLPNWYLHGLFA